MGDVFLRNDNLIEVDGLREERGGAYVNDATVKVTLTDGSGQEVGGETWPVTLSYVNGSNGRYQGTLRRDLQLIDGQRYLAVVTAESGGLAAEWTLPLKARTRMA